MKKIVILLFFILFSKSLYAQEYTKKYSSLNGASSGYYSAYKSGSYATNDNGSIQTSNNGTNLNVTKLNNEGCIEWSFDYDFGANSKGTVIKQLSDGNFLVCGTFGYDTIGMKIDAIGNIIWSKKYELLYGSPCDFVQKGSEVIILTGYGSGGFNANNALIQIDETNGNLISSKEINRVPLESADLDVRCSFNRILSIGSGYILGGFSFMNKYFSDPLATPSYSYTPILAFLDSAGIIVDGRYFTEGATVKEIIQTISGQYIVAIENHDYRYMPAIPNSLNRLSLFKIDSFGIWWKKTYVSPSSSVLYVANQIPNNMEFTPTGDILIAGFVDQGLGGSVYASGNYIFKVNGNGNKLSELLVFNNSLNQGVTGLKITPTNDFVLGMYTAGITRFTSNLLTSLCDYTSIPIDEFDDTVTSLLPTNMIEITIPINSISITPLKTITNPVVTTICGTACPSNLPCYGSGTTTLTTGLLAYYPFGGGSLNDYSGNGHHLTNITTAHSTRDRNGNVDCAFNFTKANNEKLQIISPSFLDNLTTSPFSISLWYQPLGPRPIGDYEQLIGRDNTLHCPDTYGQWSMGLYDCRKVVVGFDMNSHWQTSTLPDCNTLLNTISNNWHHIAFVYDGTSYNVYVDGVLDNNTHGPCGSISANIGNLLIGKDYTGDLDDILIYNRALTSSEVIQIQGLGSSCCSDNPLSINNLNHINNSNIKLFPNPANDFITIQNNEKDNANFEYKIVDLIGRIVLRGKSNFNENINIGSMKNGNYFIQIQAKNNEKTILKLIKN